MKKTKQKKSRPLAYHLGQHSLICDALRLPKEPSAPGLTAYEGVCVLLSRIDDVKDFLSKLKGQKAKLLLKQLKKPINLKDFIVPLY